MSTFINRVFPIYGHLRANIYQNYIRADLFNVFIWNYIITLLTLKETKQFIGTARNNQFVYASTTFIKFKIRYLTQPLTVPDINYLFGMKL